MAVDPCPHFPGPAALGRSVVVLPGQPAPDGFPGDAPRIGIDEQVLRHAAPATARLHLAWVRREPVVIELGVDNGVLRAPDTLDLAPHKVPHGFTFDRDRLHFLVWANSYDARDGHPVWWHGELARRRGGDPSPVADVRIGGRDAWADGGPRGPVHPTPHSPAANALDGIGLVHRETIQLAADTGRLHLLGDPGSTSHGLGLADDQRAAVAHAAGPARIIAPAGSGKTRVLTARMRHLVDTLGFEPQLVTAVAYNTRAADEMRERLATTSRRAVRTFHGLGKWICDLERRREVVDERQQRTILDRIVRSARIPNTDPHQAHLDALALVRLGLVDPFAAGLQFELDDFDETFVAYRAELERRGWIDFDDMIYHAIEVLLTNPGVRATVQLACTHLLVDEFQDLTPAFHLLLRLVASPALDVFGVGDDDQVIYGYAGADPDYLIEFAREFPGAGDHPLTTNWRCPAPVVRQVATLLGHNRQRVAKVIEPGRPDTADAADSANTADARQVAVHAVDASAMAGRTVAVVRDHLAAGVSPADVAVLVRVNATLLPVQVQLALADVPHAKVLDASVLQRTGIRTALAYLRLALDPERMQRADIMETLNRPSRKVKSAVSDHLRGRRMSLQQLAAISEVLSPTHAERWDDYLDDIMVVSNTITEGATTAGCLNLIRTRIGLGAAMATLDSSRSRPEGSSHGDDLDALAQLAMLQPDVAEFEAWLRASLQRPGADDGVVLSTVHRVKGMEWDHVVVHAANDGLLPHRLADDVEEERRVFHVALTRCRESVAVVADAAAVSPFVADLSSPADAAATIRKAAGQPPTAAVVDGVLAADPGVAFTAPGGIDVTVAAARGGRVDLDVDGVAAWLPFDAPVTVDGVAAQLGRPRPVRTTRTARGEDGRSPTLSDLRGHFADRHEERRAARSSNRRAADEAQAPDLDAEQQAMFDELRRWRTETARTLGMPPYIVFSDRTLTDIVVREPSTLHELLQCHGVGATKLDQYGDDVLAVLDVA